MHVRICLALILLPSLEASRANYGRAVLAKPRAPHFSSSFFLRETKRDSPRGHVAP